MSRNNVAKSVEFWASSLLSGSCVCPAAAAAIISTSAAAGERGWSFRGLPRGQRGVFAHETVRLADFGDGAWS